MASGGLRYQYARLSLAEKLIAINVAIFIILRLVIALMGLNQNTVLEWLELPNDLYGFFTKPWTIVTYAFIHLSFMHIFWNMLVLYFSGRLFLNLFSEQRFINVYFLGVILGGSVFVASYNIFPTLMGHATSLIGASAGVAAVLIFVCTYTPNQEVRFFFVNLKLWHIGAIFVLIDLIQIPNGGNVGGRLAHLGGAALGYYYAKQLSKGTDIGSGFAKLLEGLKGMFKKSEKKPPLKTVYKKNESKSRMDQKTYDKEARQRKIDAILDKIGKSGYESLSKAEKDFLFKAGKED